MLMVEVLQDENGKDYIPYIFIDLSIIDLSKSKWGPPPVRKPLTPQPPKVHPKVHQHWPLDVWRNCPDCKEKK